MEIEAPKDRRIDALGDLRVLPDEVLSAILTYLTPRDVARLACVSSVMYILCNEEPLWMILCVNNISRQLQYKGSWKKTTLDQLDLLDKIEECDKKPLNFDGFYSLFLYRRLYRCYTTLNTFSFEDGNVERKKDISLEEFQKHYDCVKPVIIDGLADSWPARSKWTTEQLLLKHGETAFRISQRSPRKITMKFKDYVSYMQSQHDEDPLYIFDDKFGELAPDLLKDYNVPNLFQEDLFDVLDREQRPPFRWFIVGPERSGASWHVDPALTSAWNTLLCGRKRWALYPPGRVPLGVTVHVNEEDGDVNIDTPSSLQWWLDFYPLLADEDKPIECTQLPGETIFVPSGWWHCVLNLETTIAVTQNYVNSKNFEFVCLDMAPGYRHKGVCRAGLLALDEADFDDVRKQTSCLENSLSNSDLTRKEKRVRSCRTLEDGGGAKENSSKHNILNDMIFSYDINFLSMFLDKERDHYNSLWCSSNCIGQREMREWLRKLWVGKPGLRDLIWKGACTAFNADRWFECLEKICVFHGLPLPTEDEKLPVGTGSNPVYLIADNVVKIFVEGGLEASLYSLGTELEFYSLLHKVSSPLRNHIPAVLASGILFSENGSLKVSPWDGRGMPEQIATSNLIPENKGELDYPFGIWSKKEFEYRKAGLPEHESVNSGGCSTIWPFIVTRRCTGKVYAEIRDSLSWDDTLNLASFLGEQMRILHLVPCPPFNNLTLLDSQQITELPSSNGFFGDVGAKVSIPAELEIFIRTLNRKKKDINTHLTKWGDPIPMELIEKVDEYIPDDFAKFFYVNEDRLEVHKYCTWIHTDVMDDNIHMEPSGVASCTTINACNAGLVNSSPPNSSANGDPKISWYPNHILDFSNLSVGDPILDLIPIHVDIFRGNYDLLKQFLESYKLPLGRRKTLNGSVENNKYGRLSYLVMCYCILHDDNVLGAIFSLWKELRKAKSWEEVEDAVWGDINTYTGLS